MKNAFSVSMVIFSNLAYAGTFLEKGLFIENNVAVGFGKTRSQAKNDAQKAIPSSYAVATDINSPAIQCTGSNVWNDKEECGAEVVRYVISLNRK